jgi:hypothetical protein
MFGLFFAVNPGVGVERGGVQKNALPHYNALAGHSGGRIPENTYYISRSLWKALTPGDFGLSDFPIMA